MVDQATMVAVSQSVSAATKSEFVERSIQHSIEWTISQYAVHHQEDWPGCSPLPAIRPAMWKC